MIVPLPQFCENNSGFEFGFPHLEGSFTFTSSVTPLVHSALSSTKYESTSPQSLHVGNPSRDITLVPPHSMHIWVLTGFISLFSVFNRLSTWDHIYASIVFQCDNFI